MGYRMYVETEDEEELFCGGKLFGYVSLNLCESYKFLKGYCYFTDQLDQLDDLHFGNPCSFHFRGKIIKEFLINYFEDFKKLKEGVDLSCPDECIKNLNDNTLYVLSWY